MGLFATGGARLTAGCIICGKPVLPAAIRHSDPFCSSVCAKLWYGTLSTEEATRQRRHDANTLQGDKPKHQDAPQLKTPGPIV